jgi:hypothetical protein
MLLYVSQQNCAKSFFVILLYNLRLFVLACNVFLFAQTYSKSFLIQRKLVLK